MERPRISKIDSWSSFENRILKVLILALNILRSKNIEWSDFDEILINKKLYFCMLEAVRQSGGEESGINSPPAYECVNQPLENEDSGKARPDFQWRFIDHLEPDARKSAKNYYIECKRLGSPVSRTWKFNKNYITNGVLRFIKREHNYGRASSSGAMIGYVQSMELAAILTEVNNEANIYNVPLITLSSDGWKENDVSRLEQEIEGREIEPASFYLRHLWVDLR